MAHKGGDRRSASRIHRPDEKFATVIGSSNSDEAKIGGMTPAVFSLSGRCEDSPWNMRLPICRFGYWTSNSTLRTLHENDKRDHEDGHDDDGKNERRGQSALAAEFKRSDDGGRKFSDDPGENDQRNTVADAACGDLFTEPHQEHGAANERDDRCQPEEQRPDR